MSKSSKSFDKKLLISLFIIVALLSTFMAYTIYAQTITNEMTSTGDGSGGRSDIYYEDLISEYDIFCSQKGGALPGRDGGKTVKYSVSEVKDATPMEAYILAEMKNNVQNFTTEGVTFATDSAGHKLEYTGDPNELASFTVGNQVVYVLQSEELEDADGHTTNSEYGISDEKLIMQDTDGKYYYLDSTSQSYNSAYGVYSYVQRAWWNTEEAASNGSNYVPGNELSNEAEQFESYMDRLSQKGWLTSETEEKTVTDLDSGASKTVTANKIDYKADFNETDATSSWDGNSQSWMVGPFSIDYIEASAKVDGREAVIFSGITSAEVYTNASTTPLVRGTDYEFVWLNGQRDASDTSIYPHENEEFYIRLFYKENATKMNMKFHFQYMNASGQYEKLVGDVTTDDGKTYEAQTLAGGLVGARWYEQKNIEWSIGSEHAGSLYIQKSMVGYNNSPIGIVSSIAAPQYYTFKITYTYADGRQETDQVKVMAGSAVTTKPVYWSEGESAPRYKVEEILNNYGYQTQVNTVSMYTRTSNETAMLNGEGQMQEDSSIQVCSVPKNAVIITNNQLESTGGITVRKTVQGNSTAAREFTFQLRVTGTFAYNGQSYTNQTITIPVKVMAGSAVTVNGFTWYGLNAPRYEIIEERTDNYSNVTITPRQGTLVNGTNINVTAINYAEMKHAKLHIIKTLENADRFSEDYLESLVFKFRISVDGYGTNQVKLKAIRQGSRYVWSYTSDDYYWAEGETLHYTIKEIELPDGTEFANATSNDTSVSVSGTTVSGILEDADGDFLVTNEITNRVVNDPVGNIRLLKKIEDNDALKNRDYKFVVKVSGTFEYGADSFTNETVYLTNSGVVKEENYDETRDFVTIHVGDALDADWTSNDFKWHGKAPKYEVEEDMTELTGVQSTINPQTGSLRKGETITVTIENRINAKKGALHIIKTLENAEKYSDEYIKSLQFTFHITVGGTDYGKVTLSPEKVNDAYVWEYTGEYSWTTPEDNPDFAPDYTIEEVDLPDGTEFVSANGNTTAPTVTGTLKPDTEDNYTIENTFINKLTQKSGTIKIEKKVLDDSLNGKEFKFNLKVSGTFEYNGTQYDKADMEINDIVVAGGSSWESTTITWNGDDAPTYVVEEQASDIAEQESIIGASGTLAADEESNVQVVTATNKAKKVENYIQITKKLEDGAVSDEMFYFDITVDGYETYTVGVKAGDTYRSEPFVWDAAAEAPNYTVTEHDSDTAKFISMTDGTQTVTTNTITGKLDKETAVNLTCINKLDKHTGKLKITKDTIIDEKLQNEAVDGEFTIQVVVSGTFEMDGESIVDGSRTIERSVKAGESFELEASWYGEYGPSYKVTELNLPEGWTLENISNGEGQFSKDATEEVIVTNALRSRVELELTMEMAGHVWEDKKVENKEVEQVETYGVQGKFDANLEEGIDGVAVYIYRVVYNGQTEVSRELAKGYEQGSNIPMEFPIYTENGGYWNAPKMSVPALTEEEKAAGYTATYDVEFVYDGQTYEPTDFLVTSNGDAEAYRAASTSKRDDWANDSMALDVNREEVDNRVGQVLGDRAIDGEGNTIGKVLDANGGNEQAVYYQSTDYTEGLEASRKVSELQTIDENGNIYDLYQTKARTSAGGLTYPFDSKVHLEDYDKYIDETGVVESYKYSATYNYVLNINLGLIKREEADISTMKDLYSAKVISNEKALNYRFNTLADLTGNVISRQLQADTQGIEYTLGLYKTDYYYRAEIYQTNGRVYDAIENFYHSIGKEVNDTELDVYLTYKIKVYNESPTYVVGINSINDYFDNSFALVTGPETKYLQTVDGKEIDSVTEVANKSYVEMPNGQKQEVNWEMTGQDIKGSDGVTYNKMTANFASDAIRLASGEKAEISVTFKVTKDDTEGVKDAVVLGQKANVAEIANYSTYYQDTGKIAGKIDRDSAPANVNIELYNDRSWYEDDTDSAPILNLAISGEQRKVDGIAWEDKEDADVDMGQKVGNGKYDDGEALIGGLTTQLVEKVTIKNGADYVDYDFLWPTNRPLDALGGRTVESISGFDSTIETSRTPAAAGTDELGVGEYRFAGIPAGNYVVRFLYGNDKTELEDTNHITGDATAYHADGTIYSGDAAILTANYDGDAQGRTSAVYNGQDYKTTAYQAGSHGNGYVDNAWHDLTNTDPTRFSDARDSEARRLEAMANSTTITNVNGTTLATANDKTANHTGLYTDYYMFADTAKINVALEDLVNHAEALDGEETIGDVTIQYIKGITSKADVHSYTYEIKQIDVGLEERSETNIVLDKEISSIRLITSDNETLFNAKYNIAYDTIGELEYRTGKYTKIAQIGSDYLVAKVELDTANSVGIDQLQAINKEEDKDLPNGTQNFRFINVDETILQGSTIEVNYQLTALNVGETDRLDNKLLAITSGRDTKQVAKDLLNAAKAVQDATSKYTDITKTRPIGEYLGTTYYQGANANRADAVATTTVRQLVDYIDNDTVFTAANNNGVDSSWRNTTINEITGNGFRAQNLLQRDIIRGNNIQDKTDVVYITDQKNNVTLSVDSIEDTETLTNKGFEVQLTPYQADNTKYSSKIAIQTSRTIAAESDADSLAFDNLSEIVKFDNTVGRRDVTIIPGNADPKGGEFTVSIEERDASATELVTLTPPTGIETGVELTLQILAVVVVALGILAGGIVIIKKKVLNK